MNMKLNVRIHPARPGENFRRCGIAFSKEWLTVAVDRATAARLQAEQALEVAVAAPDPNPVVDVSAGTFGVVAESDNPEVPVGAIVQITSDDVILIDPAPEPVAVEPAPEPEPAPVTTSTKARKAK